MNHARRYPSDPCPTKRCNPLNSGRLLRPLPAQPMPSIHRGTDYAARWIRIGWTLQSVAGKSSQSSQFCFSTFVPARKRLHFG